MRWEEDRSDLHGRWTKSSNNTSLVADIWRLWRFQYCARKFQELVWGLRNADLWVEKMLEHGVIAFVASNQSRDCGALCGCALRSRDSCICPRHEYVWILVKEVQSWFVNQMLENHRDKFIWEIYYSGHFISLLRSSVLNTLNFVRDNLRTGPCLLW